MQGTLRTKMIEERGKSIVFLIHVSLKKHNAQGLICTTLAENEKDQLHAC